MFNLREELKTYIDEGSINWDNLKSKVKGFLKLSDSDDNLDIPFLKEMGKLSQKGALQVNFKDNGKRKQLIIKNPEIKNDEIYCLAMGIKEQRGVINEDIIDSSDNTNFMSLKNGDTIKIKND